MRLDINATIALFVAIVGTLFLLGFLATNAGAEWGTVQTTIAPFAVLIALAIVCIAFALRKVM